MAIKTFTDNTPLPASDINSYLANSGLVYVTQTSFTAVSEAIVDNCFSSTYTNYLIVARMQTSAADSFYQNRVSGSNAATNYNRQLVEAQSTSITTSRATGQTALVFTSNSSGAFWMTTTADVFAPNVAEPTGFQLQHNRTDGASGGYASPSVFFFYGNHNVSTAYTGFRIFVSSGNITGKLWVYGRRDG